MPFPALSARPVARLQCSHGDFSITRLLLSHQRQGSVFWEHNRPEFLSFGMAANSPDLSVKHFLAHVKVFGS